MTRLPAALLASAALAFAAVPAGAQDLNERAVFQATTLNLSAYGETRVAPDIATITLGVTVPAATAGEAMRLNRTKMNSTIQSLKAQGIADKDIQTSNLNLEAQYVYEQNKPRRLTGYQASNLVTITVRDLSRLGAVVDGVVAAGANEINGIGFGLANPQAAEDAARQTAVKALTAKAALYSTATGYKVSRLVNLSESGGYVPQPPRPMAMMKMASEGFAADTAIQGGELRVRIDVSGVYEMTR